MNHEYKYEIKEEQQCVITARVYNFSKENQKFDLICLFLVIKIIRNLIMRHKNVFEKVYQSPTLRIVHRDSRKIMVYFVSYAIISYIISNKVNSYENSSSKYLPNQ